MDVANPKNKNVVARNFTLQICYWNLFLLLLKSFLLLLKSPLLIVENALAETTALFLFYPC